MNFCGMNFNLYFCFGLTYVFFSFFSLVSIGTGGGGGGGSSDTNAATPTAQSLVAEEPSALRTPPEIPPNGQLNSHGSFTTR